MKHAVEEYLELLQMCREGKVKSCEVVGLLGLRYMAQLEVNKAARDAATRAADDCMRSMRERNVEGG